MALLLLATAGWVLASSASSLGTGLRTVLGANRVFYQSEVMYYDATPTVYILSLVALLQ